MTNPVTLECLILGYQYCIYGLNRLFDAAMTGIHGVIARLWGKTIDNRGIMKLRAGNQFSVACFCFCELTAKRQFKVSTYDRRPATGVACFRSCGHCEGVLFFRVIISE